MPDPRFKDVEDALTRRNTVAKVLVVAVAILITVNALLWIRLGDVSTAVSATKASNALIKDATTTRSCRSRYTDQFLLDVSDLIGLDRSAPDAAAKSLTVQKAIVKDHTDLSHLDKLCP